MISSCKLLALYARDGFNFCSLSRSENIEEFESTSQFGFAHCSIIVNVRSIIVQCAFEFRIIVCLGLSHQDVEGIGRLCGRGRGQSRGAGGGGDTCEAETGARAASLIRSGAYYKPPSPWIPLSSTTAGAWEGGACSRL